MNYKSKIAQHLAQASQSFGLTADTLVDLVAQPPKQGMGDYCVPCFKLSKDLKMPPVKIANDITANATKVLPDFIDKIESVAGYINIYLNRELLAAHVLGLFNKGVPVQDIGKGRTICIDYSSINIAKPFHMGHLSTTVLGGSLYRILAHLGYKVVGINHLGDYGTQFGKLIYAYIAWGDQADLLSRGLNSLLDLYVRYHEEEESNPQLADQARLYSKKIEEGDPKTLQIYDMFKEITLSEINKVYDRLGVVFDSYKGESFYLDKVDAVVDELRQKDLLSLSEGAQVVDLEQEGMPPCLILRSDGASLYATRDIAAAMYRKHTYDFYKCLYVVAYQQNLHFKQFFSVIDKMGHAWAKDLLHIPFGMVSMADGTLSTRSGKVVFLSDVLDKAVEKTLSIIQEKNPSENMHEIAESVGVGAVIYSALSSSKIKDIVFSWDKVLNFDGETGPYLQYTHARCCSVLNRGGIDYNSAHNTDTNQLDYTLFTDDNSAELLKLLLTLPDVIEQAAAEYEPSIISRRLIDIAQGYNKFYFDYKILDTDPVVRLTRLALTRAVKDSLALGLNLILLKPVEKM